MQKPRVNVHVTEETWDRLNRAAERPDMCRKRQLLMPRSPRSYRRRQTIAGTQLSSSDSTRLVGSLRNWRSRIWSSRKPGAVDEIHFLFRADHPGRRTRCDESAGEKALRSLSRCSRQTTRERARLSGFGTEHKALKWSERWELNLAQKLRMTSMQSQQNVPILIRLADC